MFGLQLKRCGRARTGGFWIKPFTRKPLTQSRCLSTAHEVTLPFNHSGRHAACQPLTQSLYLSTTHAVTLHACQPLTQSRCLSTTHAVTLPVNRPRSHAACQPLMQSRKALVSSEGEKQTPTLPVVRQETGQESSSGTEMWLHHHHHHHILLYVLFLHIGAHSRLHIKEPKHTHTHAHTHTHTHTHTRISWLYKTLCTAILNNNQAFDLEEDSSADRKIWQVYCLWKKEVLRFDWKSPERVSVGEEGEGHSM